MYPATSGRMLIVQTDHPFRFMIPALAFVEHYHNPAANRATKITAPAEDLERVPAPSARTAPAMVHA